MKSNSFFSLNRFVLLLRNDILLNYKKYLLTIAGAFILGFMVMYTNMPHLVVQNEYRWIFDAQDYLQTFTMCLVGLMVFVGSGFPGFSSKTNTFNYLQIPASTFEKYLCQFTIYVFAGSILFFIIFWMDAHLARTIALNNLKYSNDELVGAEKFKYIKEFSYKSMFFIVRENPVVVYRKWTEIINLFVMAFSVGMYFFNVKLIFKKLGVIKAALSLVALIFLIMIFFTVLSKLYFPETEFFEIAKALDYKRTNGISTIDLWMTILAYCVPFLIIPFGYFKLKEKQV